MTLSKCFNGANIAVIEDDPAVLAAIQFALESEGYLVAAYGDAAAFMNVAPDPPPACLIVDYNMADMTGLELAAALARRDRRLPIILITASLTPAIEDEAVRLGVRHIIEKPIIGDALSMALKNVLGNFPCDE